MNDHISLPFNQPKKKEKLLAQFMDRLIQYMGIRPKVDAVFHFWTWKWVLNYRRIQGWLWKTVMRTCVKDKSSQEAELQEVNLVIYFV